jgi:beta-mannosidase
MAEGGDEQARLADGEWTDAIPAQVPGSVHAALVAAGKLPDPTVGRNQLIVAQASYKTWWLGVTVSLTYRATSDEARVSPWAQTL